MARCAVMMHSEGMFQVSLLFLTNNSAYHSYATIKFVYDTILL